ncbi:hypothetical protein COCCU_14580 (plasmid) [Corynebacterium occultum]|uniref:HNH nuclease domain-containing protein n=1 Tax=Corynebacterium occultum TaxID=2675219 RepID=A0A6B8WD85_9CORY|nr:hypothetical protein [Corynebacterium occultum]QGU08806.1 hypothetical protein COCCU_14580 [Corynebacterium occultum]
MDDGLFPAPAMATTVVVHTSRIPVIPDPDLPLTTAVQHRFWKHVVRGEGDRCWIWIGAISSPDGYGRFTWQKDRHRRTVSAHRVALMIAHGGELPQDLVGEHYCCEPLCVRVGDGHLRLTTQATNLARAVALGRHVSNRETVASHDRAQRSYRIRDAVLSGWDDDTLHAAQGGIPTPENQPGLW